MLVLLLLTSVQNFMSISSFFTSLVFSKRLKVIFSIFTMSEFVNQSKELVHENRRLIIRDLADTMGISRGSLNTVSKDILGRQLVVFASRECAVSHCTRSSWPFRQKLNAYRSTTTIFAWFGSVWLLAIPQTQKTTPIQAESKKALKAIPEIEFNKCFDDWKKRWHKWIVSGGD